MSSVTRHPRYHSPYNASGVTKKSGVRLPRPRSGAEWVELEPRAPAHKAGRLGRRALFICAYVLLVVAILAAMITGQIG